MPELRRDRFFLRPLGDSRVGDAGTGCSGIGGHSHESSTEIDSKRALAKIEIIARMLILNRFNFIVGYLNELYSDFECHIIIQAYIYSFKLYIAHLLLDQFGRPSAA